MPTLRDFNLPDLGEGLTEGEIVKWLVKPGDTVTLNQPIVEVETAKAAVEIPSPYAGVVTTLHHGEGETVDVGSPIITFDVDPEGAAPAAGPAAAMTGAFAPGVGVVDADPRLAEEAAEEKIEVLVGSGPKAAKVSRRPRRHTRPAAPPPPSASVAGATATAAGVAATAEVHVLAKPPVRKLARDLGVDLASVPGSGPGGVITREDVQAAAGAAARPEPAATAGRRGPREERIPIRGVRKATAAAMVASAFTAPHVSEFVTVDVTETMRLVDRLRELPEFAGVRVSPLLLVAKALLAAVRRHPMVNSSWDEDAGEIVVKHYVNLGIAAATDRGLIVPNIKDADRLTLVELAHALQALVDTARAGRTSPADMQHGTITITNVGVFGVDTGTPILNPGEAAILCFGAVREAPWVHEGQLAVRTITQLGMSFDHRIIDGQLGSQFLADVAGFLSDPARLLAFC